MRGTHRRPLEALLIGLCVLALIGCDSSDSDGNAGSSSTADTGGSEPELPPITSWEDDGDAASADAEGTPDEPEAGPTDPVPQVPDAEVPEEDISAPTEPDVTTVEDSDEGGEDPADVGPPPVFEGDAVTPADPTDHLLCTVSGAADDVVDCEFHLAILSGSASIAALELHFPLSPYAELVGVGCASNGEDTCQGKMQGPLPSGHTYSSSYSATTGASLVLMGLSTPSPLTAAVYDGETITGETFVLSFQLKLLEAVGLEVRVPNSVFSSSAGVQLEVEIVDGVWVTAGGS